jgi:DNA (cytosine-5)-methyltransferase 1
MKKIKVGSDFSGVGAFNQALTRLGIEYQEVYACDMDKYARQTFIHNYGEPKYYPLNVYDREIPSESLDIYMTSPPCQAFSLAGKRLGKDDKRGILFFNSLEFIQVNKPRFFIFENVKGLLSDDGGKTFSEWVILLGGKSVNGNPVIFAYDDSVPYHLYWKVLNAKQHGVPQNRERVFLIGIRDDQDNTFRWPVEEHLTKRLKDVLEEEVDDKYFLSDEHINNISRLRETLQKHELPNEIRMIDSYNKSIHENSICISTRINASSSTHLSIPINKSKENNEQKAIILDCYNNTIKIKSATSKGYEEALDTGCNQGVIQFIFGLNKKRKGMENEFNLSRAYSNKDRVFSKNGISPTIMSQETQGRYHTMIDNYKIRRLTPRECFRLMDFPDTFTWPVSDSQAYKQAGNSIVVRVLEKIIKKLPL